MTYAGSKSEAFTSGTNGRLMRMETIKGATGIQPNSLILSAPPMVGL